MIPPFSTIPFFTSMYGSSRKAKVTNGNNRGIISSFFMCFFIGFMMKDLGEFSRFFICIFFVVNMIQAD